MQSQPSYSGDGIYLFIFYHKIRSNDFFVVVVVVECDPTAANGSGNDVSRLLHHNKVLFLCCNMSMFASRPCWSQL